MESSINSKKVFTTQEYLQKLDNEYYQKFEETEEEFWDNLGITYNEWAKAWSNVKFN